MSDPKTNEQPHMVSPGGGHLGSREVSRIEYEQRGRIRQLERELSEAREARDMALNAAKRFHEDADRLLEERDEARELSEKRRKSLSDFINMNNELRAEVARLKKQVFPWCEEETK